MGRAIANLRASVGPLPSIAAPRRAAAPSHPTVRRPTYGPVREATSIRASGFSGARTLSLMRSVEPPFATSFLVS